MALRAESTLFMPEIAKSKSRELLEGEIKPLVEPFLEEPRSMLGSLGLTTLTNICVF
jgi:hypothetical protein